jgi:putative ABC transport system substrate-binding protein
MQGLQRLGWTDGLNVRINISWTGGSADRLGALAKELVELKPDVILAHSTPVAAALQQATRTIPIVFVVVSDPVGDGFVVSLPRPGGNLTGFINIEASMGGKWLQLLMEIAPSLKRVAMMFNPDTSGGTYYLTSFETSAQSLKIDSVAAPFTSTPKSRRP